MNDIAEGECPPDTEAFFSSLGQEFVGDSPHIYATREDVRFHNATRRFQHKGDAVIFKANDTGSRKQLDANVIAEETVALKVGVPVMLIHNLSSALRNGSRSVAKFVRHWPTDLYYVTAPVNCTAHQPIEPRVSSLVLVLKAVASAATPW